VLPTIQIMYAQALDPLRLRRSLTLRLGNIASPNSRDVHSRDVHSRNVKNAKRQQQTPLPKLASGGETIW
jgi:hypothetical protein